MFESKNKLYIFFVEHLKEDGNNDSDAIMKVIPCSDRQTAERFEKHYKENMPDTQLMQIKIIESAIYSDSFEGAIRYE